MILQAFLAAFSIQGIHGFPMAKPAWGELAALKSLHSDAVKASSGDNLWFSAIDAKTLDRLIIEMNEMNRWFAKVVKYWDDFSAGGNGEQVLKQNGKGIKTISEKPEGDGQEGAGAEGDDQTYAGGDGEDAGAGDDAAAGGDDAEGAGADGDDAAAMDGDAAGTDGADGADGADAEDDAAADGG